MSASIILAAIVLDIVMGDPRSSWHPVIMIGNFIALLEKLVRPFATTSGGLRVAGIIVVITVVLISYGMTAVILYYGYQWHTYLGYAVAVVLLSCTIATKSLAQAGMEIYQLLTDGNISQARHKLSWIVGRDTAQLDTPEIVRGTVETVAENIVDGILSPLFYAAIGGVPLAMAYRAINTMDSMLGYKNEKYLYFGWSAARLDDVANFIPARITGGILLLTSLILGFNTKQAWTAICNDAPGHPSPNSGIPEAAVAGALGIRLGGQNFYQGISSLRAYMGQPIQPLEPKHIRQTVMMMYVAVGIFACIEILILWRFA